MTNRLMIAVVLAACITLPMLALADTHRGTPDEARAMLDRAIAHYEQVGRDQALADFTAQKEPFKDRDLYVFCYGSDRTITSHGADAGYVGYHYDELRDVDDYAFGTEIWNTGNQPDGGTVEYKWLNPVNKAIEPKVTFVRQAGDGDDVCGVGVYQDD